MSKLDFLKERAKEFWEVSQYLYEKGKYNLSAFNLEQATQLWLKYLIGIKVGEWPKTHYLNELIEELSRVYENQKILEYLRENEIFFENLSDSYFTSRYFSKIFSKNLVEKLMKNCKEFFELLEKITGEKFFI